MFLSFGNGEHPTEKELWGYPVFERYRYLGGVIDNKLKAMTHMNHIARKIAFLQYKLTPIRLLKDLRLTINLFRILCLPLVRMGLLNALGSATATDKQNYFKLVRAKFKSFCFLPKCLPNRIVNYLLGDTEAVAKNLGVRSLDNLERDGLLARDAAGVQRADAGYFTHVPGKLYGLLDLMYRRACV